jgi:hypothetical protein
MNKSIFANTPAVFATRPHSRVSDKYLFVPTIDIVGELEKHNFVPVKAVQDKSVQKGKQRVLDLSTWGKHMVTFRHKDNLDNRLKYVPELLTINAHDGRNAFRAFLGYFIKVCENGLVMGEIETQIREIHYKYVLKHDILQKLQVMYEKIEVANQQIKTAESIRLTKREIAAFAKKAHQIRFEGKKNTNPNDLLKVRRPADDNDTLWSVFNRVQENVIKGGIDYVATNGTDRYVQPTRPLANIRQSTAMNVALWSLMLQYTKRK